MTCASKTSEAALWSRDTGSKVLKQSTESELASKAVAYTMASGTTEPEPAGMLVPKRNCTSAVWEYFGFKRDDVAQSQVLCKTCLGRVSTSRGNTTNLYQHLKTQHKTEYDRCMAENLVVCRIILVTLLGKDH